MDFALGLPLGMMNKETNMPQITLTSDQAFLVGSAESTLLVRDPSGQVVGILAKCDESGKSLKRRTSGEDVLAAEMAAWDAASDEDFQSFIGDLERSP
jgi:hypothetical protein